MNGCYSGYVNCIVFGFHSALFLLIYKLDMFWLEKLYKLSGIQVSMLLLKEYALKKAFQGNEK